MAGLAYFPTPLPTPHIEEAGVTLTLTGQYIEGGVAVSTHIEGRLTAGVVEGALRTAIKE